MLLHQGQHIGLTEMNEEVKSSHAVLVNITLFGCGYSSYLTAGTTLLKIVL